MTCAVNVELVHIFSQSFAEKIGVLTKADTVQPREHEPWIKILRNLEHKIRYGYYMTRQLTTDQVKNGMTWEEGRTQEREFFEHKKPWCEERKERLGTERLVNALSGILQTMISERCIILSCNFTDR